MSISCLHAIPVICCILSMHQIAHAAIHVSGRVVDMQGRGVAGATVTVNEPPTYVLSAFDGSFLVTGENRSAVRTDPLVPSPIPVIRLSRSGLTVHTGDRVPGQRLQASLYNIRGERLAEAQSLSPALTLAMQDPPAGFYILQLRQTSHTQVFRLCYAQERLLSVYREGVRTTGAGHRTSVSMASTRFIQAGRDSAVSERIALVQDSVADLVLTLNGTGSLKSPADYVNPFICTAGDHGQQFPGPTLPWGVVKLSPDTEPRGHSGYNYYSSKLRGFSHARAGGEGCEGTGGALMVRPGTGTYTSVATMDKASEKARAGYYRVRFGNPSVLAELTVGHHVGMHRYTFPRSDSSYIHFDLRNAYGQFIDASYEVTSGQEIYGTLAARNTCDNNRYTLHFSAVCSKPFAVERISQTAFLLRFATSASEQVYLRVGLSPISTDEAAVERDAVTAGWNFDELARWAAMRWNTVLGRFVVEGEEEYRRLFYTHLYHAYIAPVNLIGTSGSYMGADKIVRPARRAGHYGCWSIWDTYRTKHPLLTIAEPLVARDIVLSLLDRHNETRVWSDGTHEPYPRIRTDQMVIVIADAFAKGLVSDDEVLAVYSHLRQAVQGQPFERNYAQWIISTIAGRLKRFTDQETFLAASLGYDSLWNSTFKDLYDDPQAASVGGGLYEGTRWQYRWFVPHDIQGLINLSGGPAVFRRDLEYFFENDLYNHGNQPDIQVAYLFNYCGAPWLTQKWVRRIMAEPMRQLYGTHSFYTTPYFGRIYKDDPAGYIPEMDDDVGTMSAWYVLSSLGIYPACPGEPVYQIGTPLFSRAVIYPDDSTGTERSFSILANNLSSTSFYIQSARLNGQPLERPWLRHDEIAAGGALELEMGSQPNQKWGSSPDVRPPSVSLPR